MKKIIAFLILLGFLTSCGPKRLKCGPRRCMIELPNDKITFNKKQMHLV